MKISHHVFSIQEKEIPVVHICFEKEEIDTPESIDNSINEYMVKNLNITSYVYRRQSSDANWYVYSYRIIDSPITEENMRKSSILNGIPLN